MVEVASAFVSLVPSARGFGSATDKQIGKDLEKSGQKAGTRFGGAIKAGAIGVLAGGAVLGKFLGDTIAEARESQKVSAITAQVIKSTGGAAKVTEKQVGSLATAISNKTGIDDEAIQSASNLLLTFTNVRNEVGKGNKVFDEATKIATDMGAALGTEPKAAAIQLGKALNDPVKGISALSRVGVSFTDQQKKQITALVKSGDTLKAQKIILKELNREFGGTAEASSTAGEKAGVAFGNLKEQIGTALLPVVDKLSNYFTDKVAPAISSFVSGMQSGKGAGGAFVGILKKIGSALKFVVDNKEAFGTFAGIILTVVGAIKIWTGVQAALNVVLTANPIGLIVVAVAALVAGLIYAYKNSETFRKVVNTAFHAVGEAGKWLWNNVLQPVFKFLVNGFATVMDFYAKMLDGLAKVPGFGWAKKAADGMRAGADAARDLADNINKIPDHKKVTVSFTYTETNLKSIMKHQAGDFRLDGARAAGGPVRRGGTYLVGENGPELFTAPKTGTIVPNLAGVGAGGGQEIRGTLAIDRDGVAYIHGVARQATGSARVAAARDHRKAATDGIRSR